MVPPPIIKALASDDLYTLFSHPLISMFFRDPFDACSPNLVSGLI